MYEASFGLSCRPFPSVPQIAFYYPATAIEYARQTLARCVERGEGVGVAVGPTGCGKSLLGKMVAARFAERMRVVHLPSGRLDSRRSLLQAMLYGLGCPFRGMDEGELRLALLDSLSQEEHNLPMLLVVDEAHALSLRLLDELRMATNLAAGGAPSARLVLLGSSILEEKLTSPKLESLSQRIVARCYLEALNRSETRKCIRAQLAAASAAPGTVFTEEACDAVYQATDGVPRLVNQLCDHALILTFADGKAVVGRECVEEAWADLQQLPTPWNGEARERSEMGIIEFGGLDDGGGSLEFGSEIEDPGPPEQNAYHVPALRVAPDEDAISRSSRQLDAVEESLGDLEEDFEPAGRIAPEVELIFHDPVELLDEDFEEEEIILDRYSRTEPPAGEAAGSGKQAAAFVATASPDERTAVAEQRPEPAACLTGFGSEADEHDEVENGSIPAREDLIDRDPLARRVIPKVGHNDFARLFSNLRRAAT